MTKEQLNRAESILCAIHGCSRDLERVDDLINRIPEICSHGLRINGLINNTVIVPREYEIKDMLNAMRDRIEKHKAKLEKEFAEL